MRKKSPMRIGLPLIFVGLAISRLPYRAPCILSISDLRFPARPVKYVQRDLPLSDIEFCITYPEVAKVLGFLK